MSRFESMVFFQFWYFAVAVVVFVSLFLLFRLYVCLSCVCVFVVCCVLCGVLGVARACTAESGYARDACTPHVTVGLTLRSEFCFALRV